MLLRPGSNSGRFGRPPHSRRHAPSLPVDGAVARFVRELVSRPGRPPASAPPPAGAVAQSQKPNLLALSESLMSHAAAAARRYGGRLSGAKGCRRQRAAFSLSLSSSDVDEAHAWLAVNLGAVQRRVSQGSSAWSSFCVYELDGRLVFCKHSAASGAAEMYAAEASGLRALASTRTLRVPQVLHTAANENSSGAYLLLEHLQLAPAHDQAALGTLLARLHATPAPTGGRFGFECDNTIGGTPQLNSWSSEGGTAGWVEFYADRRLRPQLARTRDSLAMRLGERLIERLPAFFDGVPELQPSLIHGDFWAGNLGAADGAQPCVFDPACSYSHSEMEFGMSWCINLSPAFWHAYHAVLPRQPGWEQRQKLYKLYHYLNHWSLFGGGYEQQAMALLQELAR